MTIGAGWDLVREIRTMFIRMAEEHGGEACRMVGPSPRFLLTKILFPRVEGGRTEDGD